ncbi:MAG: hybrid sensor histidine kinase/response regulator [Acidimicrobiales bacterium]
MADDPYKYFRVEARDLLGEMHRGTMDLVAGSTTPAVIAALLRHAHTLKGAARVVQQVEIADGAHTVEEVLDPFRQSADSVPRGVLDHILRILEEMVDGVSRLPAPEALSAGSVTPVPATERPEVVRVIRTELTDIDLLLDGVSQARTALHAIRQTSDDLTALSVVPAGGSGLTAATDDALHGGLVRGLEEGIGRLDRDLRQLGDLVERVRLVPAETLFADLDRAARDVASAQGKRVEFRGTDGGVRLDAHVVSVALAALQQVIRNAVAHGIETEAERLAAGKPGAGQVTIDVARRGRSVVFSCHDDGRGIDVEAVRRAAYRKGVDPGRIDDLGPEELTRLLLKGGISTAPEVTEISGRGIGLDIVRESVDRLRGRIRVVTQVGQGTTVDLDVPLALASFDALGLAVGSTVAYVPLDAVTETIRVDADEIHRGTEGLVLSHAGAVLPYLDLRTALGRPSQSEPRWERLSVMVVGAGRGAAAVGAQRFLRASNIVVRPVPEHVDCVAAVGGIWIDGQGTPQIVLDPDELVAEAQRERAPVPEPEATVDLPILVVDDSLTTRMLEQSILESAGYEVEVASSGEEALTKAQHRSYRMFLVDVEMPGMDGFTFVESAKSDPVLHDVPAILITSRCRPEDLARGVAAGASAYLTKGDFDQEKLLAHIETLSPR